MSSWRYQGINLFITIKSHVSKEYIEFIDKIYQIKEWIYCHETAPDPDNGEKEEYVHSHIALKFYKKIDFRDSKKFDWKDENGNTLHPHMDHIRRWPAAVIYCMKEGTYFSNFDLSTFEQGGMGKLVENIISQPNSIDAVKNHAKSLKDIVPIIALYNQKGHIIDEEYRQELLDTKFFKWQEHLRSLLKEKPDDRTIHWIFDHEGNKGKTKFCNVLEEQEIHQCLVIAATGSLRDISDLIRNWMSAGNTPNIILIDLPRTYEDRESIYTMIESIKNGRLTCTKYKGETLKFRPPHVCVFSNWKPNYEKCSKDRWQIWELVHRDKPMISITHREIGS